MSVADRLQRALELRDLSIRAFQRRMADRDVRGNSYPSVHGYVTGEVKPSVDFLRSAAEVLEVRDEWLVLNKGEPTAAEDRLGDLAAESDSSGGGLRQRLLSDHPELAELGRAERELFMSLLARYVMSAPDAAELPMTEDGLRALSEFAGDLLFLLELPLHPLAWGFRDLEFGEGAHGVYLTAVLNCLSLIVEERGRGLPAERAEASWIRELRKRSERMERREEEGEQVFRRF